MKKTTLLLMAVLFTLCASAKKRTVVFTTQPQMHCAKCENRVKALVSPIAGVKSVETDLEEQTVTIVFNDKKTSVDKLQEALASKGYKARELKEGEKIAREPHECKEKEKE